MSQAAWADDLAEHAVHSPNWAAFEDVIDFSSDWEYYTDSCPDEGGNLEVIKSGDGTNKGKRRRTVKGDGSQAVGESRRKKKKMKTEEKPTYRHPASEWPPVVYRSMERPSSPPFYIPGTGEKVAVLKDWRERFVSRKDGTEGRELEERPHPEKDEDPALQEMRTAGLRSSTDPNLDQESLYLGDQGIGLPLPRQAAVDSTGAKIDDTGGRTDSRKRKHVGRDPEPESEHQPGPKRVLVSRPISRG